MGGTLPTHAASCSNDLLTLASIVSREFKHTRQTEQPTLKFHFRQWFVAERKIRALQVFSTGLARWSEGFQHVFNFFAGGHLEKIGLLGWGEFPTAFSKLDQF